MELVGIENEAEFFPSGALSDVLKDDLRDINSRWTDDGKTVNPVKRLTDVTAKTLRTLSNIRSASGRRRAELLKEMRTSLILSLGYERKDQKIASGLEESPLIPLAGRAADLSGRDVLWIIETSTNDPDDESCDPLDFTLYDSQLSDKAVKGGEPKELTIGATLTEGIFDLPDGPRYVLVIGFSQIVLIDKRKWQNRSTVRFNLQEIFSRAESDTLSVMACLLSREGRIPSHGVPAAERLEEEAQRNANAVTSSLKATVRDAIEILGQEVIDVINLPNSPYGHIKLTGPELSQECLIYMYRLLFLFYAEANPRLNLIEIENPIYKKGYSLEVLRDLESVPLRTTQDRNRSYLWDSLQCTLKHIYNGVNCHDNIKQKGFWLPSVKVSILDIDSTPILKNLKLRDEAMQKIIHLLSLKSTRSGTGRISYAKLGISQLGSVYETLISFTGAIAEEDLIEINPQKEKGKSNLDSMGPAHSQEAASENDFNAADPDKVIAETSSRNDKVDLLAPCWFVPLSCYDNYDSDRVVFWRGKPLIHRKGKFLYRLAGRDREKSASYYTPEPLARLLVKHALMERCKNLNADDLLDLKILEPAMGSASFLVEAVNQISDLYLERKQQEVGSIIPQEKIVLERQKVRSLIADRNCFGIDLNPIAVDLGAISLWLNSIHGGEFSPWFGDQLHAGNSLIGARRATYMPDLLTTRTKAKRWLNQNPSEIGWRKDFPNGEIWHWLLPALGMASSDNEKSTSIPIREEQRKIRKWKKEGFFDSFQAHEIELLQRLSKVANELFEKVADSLHRMREVTNDEIVIWPDQKFAGNKSLDFQGKAEINGHLTGVEGIRNTLPYKRLKTAMDAWCALWVWPLDHVDCLPSREEFLHGMAMILEGGFTVDGTLEVESLATFQDPVLDFHDIIESETSTSSNLPRSEVTEPQSELFRETNVEALIESHDWLKVADGVAKDSKFVHFDLIFADVLRDRSGFDLIVGNPPWAKPIWNEGEVLSDIDPRYYGLSAAQAEIQIGDMFGEIEGDSKIELARELNIFAREFVRARGEIAATSSKVMNPFIGKGATNLYQCFVDLSFRLISESGYIALVHQDGHLISPKMGEFRRNWYSRISKHFRFRNEIKAKMFSEIGNRVRFSLNVYRGSPSQIGFDAFLDAFLASQVDDSYAHDGVGPVEGIKRNNGEWNTDGHRRRIVRIDQEVLEAIRLLAESDDVSIEETRLILPYAVQTLDLFEQLSKTLKFKAIFSPTGDDPISKTKIGLDSQPRSQVSRHWNEKDVKKGGTLQKVTEFQSTDKAVLQGPHIGVGNPLFQTARRICNTHRAYDIVDLHSVPTSYSQRTNYCPRVDSQEFRNRMPVCAWNSEDVHADYYRIAFRRMISRDGERSLIGAAIPPGVTHVNTVLSVAFSREVDLLSALASFISLPLDFFVKISGMEDLNVDQLPWVVMDSTAQSRALRLACVTQPYEDLWNRNSHRLNAMPWSSSDPRLALEGPVKGPDLWSQDAYFKTEYSRRMALIEIDVLVAQALGFSLDQLIDIYDTYFPVLKSSEAGTWYDQNGRIVWTCSKNLTSVGWFDQDGRCPSRAAWERILDDPPSKLICTVPDDTMPDGPREIKRCFVGPFTCCDRKADYRLAWAHFEKLKAEGGA